MAYFPLFIELEGRKVLAVGAGAVGSRRIRALAEFGADVTAVAPAADPAVERLAEDGKLRLLRGTYESRRRELWDAAGEKDGAPYFLVMTATGDAGVDSRVKEDARAAGCFFNYAGDRAESDFYFPGLVKEGNVTAGVIAGGVDHRLARELTEKIRGLVSRERRNLVRDREDSVQDRKDLVQDNE